VDALKQVLKAVSAIISILLAVLPIIEKAFQTEDNSTQEEIE